MQKNLLHAQIFTITSTARTLPDALGLSNQGLIWDSFNIHNFDRCLEFIKSRFDLRLIQHSPNVNVKWVSDQTLIWETQGICQSSSSARNSGDLSTISYVWDTSDINLCFQSFGNTTQSFYYKRNNFIFNFMFCPNCAS